LFISEAKQLLQRISVKGYTNITNQQPNMDALSGNSNWNESLAKLDEAASNSVKQKIDSAVGSIKSIIVGKWFNRDKIEQEVQALSLEAGDLFRRATERVAASEHYQPEITALAPYGYFQGRVLIGESTRVNGGIYIGVCPQEAVVVDDRYGLLKRVFSKTCGRCIVLRERSSNYEYEIFVEILSAVRRMISFDPEAVDRIARRENMRPDQKISLDVYIENGVGEARHRVLLAAYLLEKLKDMGVIDGYHTIERRICDGREQEVLIYTTPEGRSWEFEPVEKPKIHRS
jgi:hypothetical protein